MERGEYALAEQLFGAVLREPDVPAHEARIRLVELFWLQGATTRPSGCSRPIGTP